MVFTRLGAMLTAVAALLMSVTISVRAQQIVAPIVNGPATGLADSNALHATVFGTPPADMAALPAAVPLSEINIQLPWRRPVPEVLWFDKRLRVWLSAQKRPAPLAIVISGTGSDGNTSKLSVLRAALYGAGYHVLTMPSPTFPGFIVSASSTGVAGDLKQDGEDLYAAMQEIIKHLPRKVQITDIDVLGYSLGGANAAVVKSIDAREGKLKIHRVIMINPPVSLFSSIGRLDKLFAQSIGSGTEGVENLYRQLYAQLANLYVASDRVEIDQNFILTAAAATLKTDAEFSAAIALTFRTALVDMFFVGDLSAKTGVVIDPNHPPQVGDSLEEIQRVLRNKPFADYFTGVFAPFYLKYRPNSTGASLIADNRLDIIGDTLRNNPDYYAQTNSDDLILNARELGWLRDTLGNRMVVYDHGGHLGTIGDRRQVADMLSMLAGTWTGGAEMRVLLIVMLAGWLGACASTSISIRSVPAETPAADNAAAAANIAAFSEAAATANGNAAAATENSSTAGAPEVAPPLTAAQAPPMYTYDPWEKLNRFTYRFNYRFDEAIFLPVANGYRRVPSPLRAGVHNFFGNLSEVDSSINYTLQWRLKYTLRSVERFVINSTLGLAGFIDVATRLKLPGAKTGFATTLARWGMHPGPYLVLPLLGPSTLRDGFGFLADYGTNYGLNIFNLYRGDVSWGLGVANAVDQRANVNFRYYSTGSPFEYETIRFLYVRKELIEDRGLRAKAAPQKPPETAPNLPAGK